MTAQSLTITMAGLFIMISLGLAHFLGHADLTVPSLLWFTAFVGINLFQSGLTGFCPMTKIFKMIGMK